jgi:hypothetical protein
MHGKPVFVFVFVFIMHSSDPYRLDIELVKYYIVTITK